MGKETQHELDRNLVTRFDPVDSLCFNHGTLQTFLQEGVGTITLVHIRGKLVTDSP